MTDMTQTPPDRGSILFYLMLAVVVFAALSFAIGNMLRGSGDHGAGERADLGAGSILEFAASAKAAVAQLKLNGVTVANMSFLRPGDAGFTTAPHTAKVFHAGGGGLAMPVFTTLAETASAMEIRIARVTGNGNYGTSAGDVYLGIFGLQRAICAAINETIRDDPSIPSDALDWNDVFPAGGGTGDMSGATLTPSDEPTLCYRDTSSNAYAFFTLLDLN